MARSPGQERNSTASTHPAVLITGMSGVGKSTALGGLARRGYTAIDTDDGNWIHSVDGEPVWRAALIDDLLDRPRKVPLIVAGTVVNQAEFYPRFDAVVLFTAPNDVIFDRLRHRTNNPFGKTARERAQIARDISDVEPLLRSAATHEIVTTCTPGDVVEQVIAIALAASSR
jgi:broad-specificity NMP kinase